MTLRQFQSDGVETLYTGVSRYLAGDPGIGKTLMAFTLAEKRGVKRGLFLCPATVKIAVVAELQKWHPEWKYHMPKTPGDIGSFKTHDVLWTVVNYDKISRGPDFVKKLIAAGPYDMLVLDEAHFLKSMSSNRTKRVFREIMKVCAYTLPMSGTPMPNNASELYPPLRYLAPELILKGNNQIMRQDEFEDRYCQITMKYVGGPSPKRSITGSRNMEDLKRRIGKFFLRIRKEDHLAELPPIQYVLEPIGVKIPKEELNCPMIPEDLSDDEFLALLNSDKEHFARVLRVIGIAKAVTAGHYIRDYLLDNDLKCVVWAKHHVVIDLLISMFQSEGLSPVKIDGRDDSKSRETAVKHFLNNKQVRVMVGQINAAGTGITLLNDETQPRDVFFVESDFVPGNNQQAACRVHRQGQNGAVLCRTFVASGVSLDMQVQRILNRKINEITQIF